MSGKHGSFSAEAVFLVPFGRTSPEAVRRAAVEALPNAPLVSTPSVLKRVSPWIFVPQV